MIIDRQRPVAFAVHIAENTFIAFGLIGVTWHQRLVVVVGCFLLVLTLCRACTCLAGAISPSTRHTFAIGIGLFLLLIGMVLAGIVADAEIAGEDRLSSVLSLAATGSQ